MSWVGLRFVIVVLPDHTHLLHKAQLIQLVTWVSAKDLFLIEHFIILAANVNCIGTKKFASRFLCVMIKNMFI